MNLPEVAADGRWFVTAIVKNAWRTLPVHALHPRKATFTLADGGLRPEVAEKDVLEVWHKPPRAHKARLVWKKEEHK